MSRLLFRSALALVLILFALPSALVDAFKGFPAWPGSSSSASISMLPTRARFVIPQDRPLTDPLSAKALFERAGEVGPTCAPTVTVTVTVPTYIPAVSSTPAVCGKATGTLSAGGQNGTSASQYNTTSVPSNSSIGNVTRTLTPSATTSFSIGNLTTGTPYKNQTAPTASLTLGPVNSTTVGPQTNTSALTTSVFSSMNSSLLSSSTSLPVTGGTGGENVTNPGSSTYPWTNSSVSVPVTATSTSQISESTSSTSLMSPTSSIINGTSATVTFPTTSAANTSSISDTSQLSTTSLVSSTSSTVGNSSTTQSSSTVLTSSSSMTLSNSSSTQSSSAVMTSSTSTQVDTSTTSQSSQMSTSTTSSAVNGTSSRSEHSTSTATSSTSASTSSVSIPMFPPKVTSTTSSTGNASTSSTSSGSSTSQSTAIITSSMSMTTSNSSSHQSTVVITTTLTTTDAAGHNNGSIYTTTDTQNATTTGVATPTGEAPFNIDPVKEHEKDEPWYNNTMLSDGDKKEFNSTLQAMIAAFPQSRDGNYTSPNGYTFGGVTCTPSPGHPCLTIDDVEKVPKAKAQLQKKMDTYCEKNADKKECWCQKNQDDPHCYCEQSPTRTECQELSDPKHPHGSHDLRLLSLLGIPLACAPLAAWFAHRNIPQSAQFKQAADALHQIALRAPSWEILLNFHGADEVVRAIEKNDHGVFELISKAETFASGALPSEPNPLDPEGGVEFGGGGGGGSGGAEPGNPSDPPGEGEGGGGGGDDGSGGDNDGGHHEGDGGDGGGGDDGGGDDWPGGSGPIDPEPGQSSGQPLDDFIVPFENYVVIQDRVLFHKVIGLDHFLDSWKSLSQDEQDKVRKIIEDSYGRRQRAPVEVPGGAAATVFDGDSVSFSGPKLVHLLPGASIEIAGPTTVKLDPKSKGPLKLRTFSSMNWEGVNVNGKPVMDDGPDTGDTHFFFKGDTLEFPRGWAFGLAQASNNPDGLLRAQIDPGSRSARVTFRSSPNAGRVFGGAISGVGAEGGILVKDFDVPSGVDGRRAFSFKWMRDAVDFTGMPSMSQYDGAGDLMDGYDSIVPDSPAGQIGSEASEATIAHDIQARAQTIAEARVEALKATRQANGLPAFSPDVVDAMTDEITNMAEQGLESSSAVRRSDLAASESLKQKIQDLNTEVGKARDDLEATRRDWQKEKNALDQTQKDLESTRRFYNTAKQDLKTAKDELEKRKFAFDALQKKFDQLKKEKVCRVRPWSAFDA